MIDAAALGELSKTYSKHGWIPRRVLLTAATRKSLGKNVHEIFGDVKVIVGHIDAVWFSRPQARGEIAWELRHLSETPFALLKYADETADDFESRLHQVESRLAETVAAKRKT